MDKLKILLTQYDSAYKSEFKENGTASYYVANRNYWNLVCSLTKIFWRLRTLLEEKNKTFWLFVINKICQISRKKSRITRNRLRQGPKFRKLHKPYG